MPRILTNCTNTPISENESSDNANEDIIKQIQNLPLLPADRKLNVEQEVYFNYCRERWKWVGRYIDRELKIANGYVTENSFDYFFSRFCFDSECNFNRQCCEALKKDISNQAAWIFAHFVVLKEFWCLIDPLLQSRKESFYFLEPFRFCNPRQVLVLLCREISAIQLDPMLSSNEDSQALTFKNPQGGTCEETKQTAKAIEKLYRNKCLNQADIIDSFFSSNYLMLFITSAVMKSTTEKQRKHSQGWGLLIKAKKERIEILKENKNMIYFQWYQGFPYNPQKRQIIRLSQKSVEMKKLLDYISTVFGNIYHL